MKTFQDILDASAALRDELGRAGQASAAQRLNSVLTSYWTTTSEALVELLNALEETRWSWETRLSEKDGLLGREITAAARDLLNFE